MQQTWSWTADSGSTGWLTLVIVDLRPTEQVLVRSHFSARILAQHPALEQAQSSLETVPAPSWDDSILRDHRSGRAVGEDVAHRPLHVGPELVAELPVGG